MKELIITFACISVFWFGYKRLLRYLRYLQQDEYDTKRFICWLKHNRSFDTRGTSAVAVVILVSMFSGSAVFAGIATIIVAAFLLVVAEIESDPRTSGKLPLVMTPRAWRIQTAACAQFALLICLTAYITSFSSVTSWQTTIGWILIVMLIQLLPLLLVVSIRVLQPIESHIRNSYLQEAKQKIVRVKPFVIGITGSYGKTSVKIALGQILQNAVGSTFWPQGGTNTLMGVTREIRERFGRQHNYAVVEMAAYRQGSISNLCQLTPPRAVIVTAIGEMHLERFGDRETVYKAKTELIRALPDDGLLVLNGDDPRTRRAAKEFSALSPLLYGFNNEQHDLVCWISDITFGLEGSNFVLNWKGTAYQSKCMLLGKPALSNLAACFTMACALGADPEYLVATIRGIQQVKNRLSLESDRGVVWLKDAYNSNPVGFDSALDVLKQLPGKRRILITPGMVELGDEQYECNRAVAKTAAQICDQVYVVGHLNNASILHGLRDGNLQASAIFEFHTRDSAFSALSKEMKTGDIILVENDLPDLLEVKERF